MKIILIFLVFFHISAFGGNMKENRMVSVAPSLFNKPIYLQHGGADKKVKKNKKKKKILEEFAEELLQKVGVKTSTNFGGLKVSVIAKIKKKSPLVGLEFKYRF